MFTCFVILNYNNYKDTIECVNSIYQNQFDSIKIVVVDNNSSNSSVQKISKQFQNKSNFFLIKSSENLGFAQGNNLGYSYCKKNFDVKYIICLNNDTLIVQKSFLKITDSIFERNRFYILGPDIVTINGIHQNPQRRKGLTFSQLQNLIQKIRILLFILKYIPVLYYARKVIHKKRNNINNDWKSPLENIQLHGACVIYSTLYIEKNEFAFLPKTFLYMEEDILYRYCITNNFKMNYSPLISIVHKEDGATDTIVQNNRKKQIFIYTHALKSANTLLKYMEEKND